MMLLVGGLHGYGVGVRSCNLNQEPTDSVTKRIVFA